VSSRDWGDVRGGAPAEGSSPSGATAALHGVLENFVRSPAFASLLERNFGLVRIYPGDIKAAATEKVQPGWLLCDGSSYDPRAYPKLYAVLGTTWGGDGVSTFAVPDLRGRTLISRGEFTGVITPREVGDYGGAETHALVTNEIPSHAHVLVEPNGGLGHRHAINVNFNPGAKNSLTHGGTTFDASDPSYEQYSTTGLTMQNTGGGAAHSNMQPFAVVTYLIYAGSN
jgi:microcystin-dependent protein